MKILIAAIFLMLVGCAAPQPAAYQQEAGNIHIHSQREDLRKVRGELDTRKRKLETAKLKEEIEQLNKEIAELNEQMAALEKRIAEYEKAQLTPKAASSGVLVGPRGGIYTISPSGKKVYRKR